MICSVFSHGVSVGHLLTWRTYGSWLPGDVRGWKPHREGFQSENRPLENYSQEHLRFAPVWLNRNQRQIIAETIVSHCKFRDWFCSAVTCQSNHVHVVLITTLAPRGAMARLKARCNVSFAAILAILQFASFGQIGVCDQAA